MEDEKFYGDYAQPYDKFLDGPESAYRQSEIKLNVLVG